MAGQLLEGGEVLVFSDSFSFFSSPQRQTTDLFSLFAFPLPPDIYSAGNSKPPTKHNATRNRFRNFPNDAARGEHLLRTGYEEQMERLGVLVDDAGLVVDLGCGSGTSTRCVQLSPSRAQGTHYISLSLIASAQEQ